MVHWNGRFGNRVFSYMYGRSYAEKGGLDFYIPSEWEGTRLFKDDGYKIIDDDELRLAVNQTMPQFDNIDARMEMQLVNITVEKIVIYDMLMLIMHVNLDHPIVGLIVYAFTHVRYFQCIPRKKC